MKLLQNISLRTKLIIATLIPVFALLYYLQLNIRQELKNKQAAQQIIKDVSVIQEISKVIHEIQKERALTLTLISSNGTKGREQIADQREATDKAVSALNKTLKDQERSIKNYSLIDSFPSVRSKVNALHQVQEIDPFYISLKSGLLDEVSNILRSANNLQLKNRFEEHLFLLYTKDFIAQIRSELASALASGRFEQNGFGTFASIKGKHEINMQKLKKVASHDLLDFFNKKYQGPVVHQTYVFIDSAFADASLSNFKYDLDTWWNVSTSSINALKEVEDYSSDIISKKAEEELQLANANVTKNVIIAVFTILLILLILTLTIRQVVNSINKIKDAADKMAKGDVDVQLDIKTKDEIGVLAKSFNQIISVTKTFSEIAYTIGKGDYSPVIKERSEKDTLSIALNKMKNNLQKLSKENEVRTWLLTGNSQLNDKLRGDKDVKSLGEDVIIQLTSYLKAQIGAIYLDVNGNFTLVGSYAYHKESTENSNAYKPGEGLVGQAALEKKPIIFNEVPKDYIRINSGIGSAVPRSIVVFPFLYDGHVKGVIEIGSVNEFTDLDKQLLSMISENVGIAFNAAESRSQLKDFLEETQRQAEELQQANIQLFEKEQEINNHLEAINKSNAAVEFDLNGNILKVNKTFRDIMGYNEDEIVGKHHSILVEKGYEKTKEYLDFWEKLRKGEFQQQEYKRVTKSGNIVWIKGNYNPIFDAYGKPYKILKIATDVTLARKQTQELAKQAEELAAQQEELKQSNEELLEKTDMLEKSEATLKVQQEELQQTNEELEEKANLLEEQKEKLEQAKMEIENKAKELEITSKYKSEFLANMSHELRTPLNSILILSQLLNENKNRSLGTKEVEFAKNIYNSGNDLLNLINEILDLSKVESGKMELDIEAVPLSNIGADLNSMFAEVARNKSVDFEININDKLLPETINTDKQRLEQIIRNLLSNAFKFTAKGGKVTLNVDKPASQIRFRNNKLYEIPHIIYFSVSDTGIGIPEDKQGIVFEAFQQADGSTKRKYGGTGLGLSISRELANALGGEIHLHSEEGKGSTFTLYLPHHFDSSVILPAERMVEVKENKMITPSMPDKFEKLPVNEEDVTDDRYNLGASDKVILIMEDDAAFANVLLEFVRDRNYKGIIAHEGTTGLSYARHHKPDAIILDMKMPVMDGTEVLKQLKNDPELRHIPVQIISGYDKRREGMELGAFNFIQKPISKKDLQNSFDRIEEFVNKKLKRILIVEDDQLQNQLIGELVGDGDVKCSAAFSGAEALEMLKKENFECVIVDLGLPDMTGFSLLEKIKSKNELKKIPVIVYTGKDLSKDETNRLNKLANTVVLKTVDSHERLLDETMLFLHRVESRLPKEKQNIIRQLHKTDEVLKNKKILLVDDDIRNIYSLTNILEDEGVICITADNGKAALNMLHENPDIDMVLMDVMMPEMDGYEATREIRNMSKYSRLPIIALTAKAMKGDREKCLNAGMSDYIAKPVNIEQLLSLMRVWLYK